MPYSRKKLDLTGRQYGSLTVLGPAENVGGRTAWLCRCSCGKETVVKTKSLRNGGQPACDACRKRGVAGLTFVDGTCVEMLRTRTVRRNNTSGVPGVVWRKKSQTWSATLTFKGERHYLGTYKRFEDAVRARREAEAFYFENFLCEFGEGPAESDAG